MAVFLLFYISPFLSKMLWSTPLEIAQHDDAHSSLGCASFFLLNFFTILQILKHHPYLLLLSIYYLLSIIYYLFNV